MGPQRAENWAIPPRSCHRGIMARRTSNGVAGGLALALATASGALAAGCHGEEPSPAASKAAEPIDISKIPTPPANGPRIGATADVTPVLAKPERGAKQLGYLHAGAKVARSAEPITLAGCPGGWYGQIMGY